MIDFEGEIKRRDEAFNVAIEEMKKKEAEANKRKEIEICDFVNSLDNVFDDLSKASQVIKTDNGYRVCYDERYMSKEQESVSVFYFKLKNHVEKEIFERETLKKFGYALSCSIDNRNPPYMIYFFFDNTK